jgi:type I restriction enzyme, S subunit
VTSGVVFPARRLKYAATINDEALSESTDSDFELAYIDIGNVDSQGRVHDVVNYRFEAAPSRARRIVRDGDVIISTVRTYLQAIAPIENPPENLIVSTGFAVVRPTNVLDHRFCKYALRANQFLWEVERRSTGVSYPAINASDLGDIKLSLPELRAQHLIANYLDRETARIDKLIAEKQRMLALLQEKRAALIGRVVTRGLDPSAPLKPSGQQWLGDIPAHWEVRTLKRSSSRIDTGTTPAASFMDGSLPADFTWFTPSDFEHGGVIAESNRKIPREAIDDGEAKVFPARSLMVIGIGATLGKVASASAEFSANQQINVLTTLESVRWDFLLYVLQGFERVFRAHSNSATLPILNQERLGVIRVPIPPSAEQEAIVSKLNESRTAYALANRSLRESISLLKERRAALITAAVTGQMPLEEISR